MGPVSAPKHRALYTTDAPTGLERSPTEAHNTTTSVQVHDLSGPGTARIKRIPSPQSHIIVFPLGVIIRLQAYITSRLFCEGGNGTREACSGCYGLMTNISIIKREEGLMGFQAKRRNTWVFRFSASGLFERYFFGHTSACSAELDSIM